MLAGLRLRVARDCYQAAPRGYINDCKEYPIKMAHTRPTDGVERRHDTLEPGPFVIESARRGARFDRMQCDGRARSDR